MSLKTLLVTDKVILMLVELVTSHKQKAFLTLVRDLPYNVS